MKVTRHILSNGLKVVIVEKPDSGVVSTSLYVGAGGRYETSDNAGISHFLEHIAFKGTVKYPTAEAFASAIESIGGKQNAWTSHDHTAFWNIVPKEHSVLAFETIAEQVTSLIFDEKEIDRERGVILEETNMTLDDPSSLAWHKLGEFMWPGQPIGNDILGPEENIKKIKKEDFTSYMDRLYVAGNMSLAVAGGLKADKVIDELEAAFGKIKKGDKSIPKEIIFDQTEPKIKIIERDTNQVHLILAYKTFSFYDKRRYALDVLRGILSGGMASRLYSEIVGNNGLAYAIYIISDYYSEFGTLAIYSGLNKDKTEKALRLIKRELTSACSEFYNETELKRAKEYVKGGYIISLENAQNLSNWYAEKEFLDPERPDPAEIVKMIESVTLEEVKEVANVIFRSERESLLVVGPFKDEKIFDKIIKENKY